MPPRHRQPAKGCAHAQLRAGTAGALARDGSAAGRPGVAPPRARQPRLAAPSSRRGTSWQCRRQVSSALRRLCATAATRRALRPDATGGRPRCCTARRQIEPVGNRALPGSWRGGPHPRPIRPSHGPVAAQDGHRGSNRQCHGPRPRAAGLVRPRACAPNDKTQSRVTRQRRPRSRAARPDRRCR